MSNHQIIPFEGSQLPAFLQGAVGVNTDLTTNVGAGYAVLSIKGKVFTLVKNQERKVITRPDDPTEAATSLEVVILRANPNLSKVFYIKGFVEGSTDAPDCYSNDGVKPDAEIKEPQCKTCAACPKNVFGTGNQGKGKACSDSRRVAIAAPSQLNEPMLLRIPPATLKPLAEYAVMLENRGVPYHAVVTKLRFDMAEATPKLTFQPVGFLSEAQFKEAVAERESDLVKAIIGLGHTGIVTEAQAPADKVDAELDKALKPAQEVIAKVSAAAAPVAEAKPAPKAEPAPAVEKPKVQTSDDLDALLDGLPDD